VSEQPARGLPASNPARTDPRHEKPPVFRTWPQLYTFVLVYLAAVIFLFWLFTQHYAPTS
jgi:hypothetical protein